MFSADASEPAGGRVIGKISSSGPSLIRRASEEICHENSSEELASCGRPVIFIHNGAPAGAGWLLSLRLASRSRLQASRWGVREPLRPRLDLNRRGHAGNEANAVGNLIDLDADRYALGEADPGEDRVDVGKSLLIGIEHWRR